MTQWLLNRLFDSGDQPKPRFAFQGTVNWMRALSILTKDTIFSDATLTTHYAKVPRRTVNEEADTVVFENMLMAFHNHAALVQFNTNNDHPYDICRSAIISWYYSIYSTASAMIAAASGASQETHSLTAKVWQSDIVNNNLVFPPFSLNIVDLTSKSVDAQIDTYRSGNTFDLMSKIPSDHNEAYGAVISYLKGCADFEKWKIEERLRGQKNFKALGVTNFRTKKARELRDQNLEKKDTNFLNQAFRYRGKANYRDSIFLSYGYDESQKVEEFCIDLMNVSKAFQRMATYYLSKRVESGTWDMFISDLESNSQLSIGVDHLKP